MVELTANSPEFEQRFMFVLSLLCSVSPPIELCRSWLAHEDHTLVLQAWVVQHMRPRWAQGIELLDLAHAVADTPAESGSGVLRSPLYSRIGVLEAELAALKEDAARWQKLVSCADADSEIGDLLTEAVSIIAFQHQVDFTQVNLSLAQKIDAAMAYDEEWKAAEPSGSIA